MKVYVIPNQIPAPPKGHIPGVLKEPGFARFLYVSRIDRKKNLSFALDVIRDLNCELHIYGPIGDESYWRECQSKMRCARAEYRGALLPEQVIPTLQRGHFLLFPSLGENFGYIIYESLCASCPVLISDQNDAWHNMLKLGGGYDLPLHFAMWRKAVQYIIDMDSGEYQELREGAALRACRYFRANDHSHGYMAMFRDAATRT